MAPSHGTKCPSYMGQYGLPITTAAVTQSYYTPRNLLTTRTGFIGARQPKIRMSTLSTTRRDSQSPAASIHSSRDGTRVGRHPDDHRATLIRRSITTIETNTSGSASANLENKNWDPR